MTAIPEHGSPKLVGKRDRELLAGHFPGALRRFESVALQLADLVEASGGFTVPLRNIETDQAGRQENTNQPMPAPTPALDGPSSTIGTADRRRVRKQPR